MKILYAANNSLSSKNQLYRFLQYNQYDIRIAAYSNTINSHYTLDSLHNIKKQNSIYFNNNNYILLYENIKKYNPDLIISDLEPFCSSIGFELKIPVWQCSSSILNFALTKEFKKQIKLYKKYGVLIRNTNYDLYINILNNSDKKLVYSCFGDSSVSLDIKNEFQWVRPYFDIGKKSINCKHNIVVICPNNEKNILINLKEEDDVVVFTNFSFENYKSFKLKDLNDESEYYCNLANSNMFINNGESNYMADAFYNAKPIVIYPNYSNIDCMANYYILDFLGFLSKNPKDIKEIKNARYNNSVKFLHEHVDEFKEFLYGK
jgi:hypothetical protein